MTHITLINWIKPKILSKNIENNILKLIIDWSGGFGTNINYSEITKVKGEYHYKDDSINLKKNFKSIKTLLWEFEFPRNLKNEIKKLK